MSEYCSQCGQPFSVKACGPTHALIANEQSSTPPAPREATETPRTDREANGTQNHWHPNGWVAADFARQLERESASLRKLLKASASALRSYQHGNESPELADEIATAIDKEMQGMK